jgi:hypothetical protein
MEIWKLLFILVVVSALGTFGVFTRFRDTLRGKPFGLHQSHLKHVTYEGFSGGFGVGFNGGFGVGANGGFGDAIEPNFGSVGVDDKKNNRVVSESFYGGGHGGGGGHHGGTWHGPGGYGGPNQGTWRGWGGDAGGGNWGWYGWSYPWAWYGPVEIAVTCYSDADCDKKSFCASNGYCSRKAVDIVAPVGVPDI